MDISFKNSVYRILLVFSISSAGIVRAETATIAIASNFGEVARHLVDEFESISGHDLTLVMGASGRFYAQISNGAPFDAFLSADSDKPAELIESGLALSDSVFTYAIGRLALWSNDETLVKDNASALSISGSHKIAYANPRLAPYGKAALEVIKALSLFNVLEGKLVQGENIAQTYQFVFTGNADLGFVALSQILQGGTLGSGSAWVIPKSLHSPIRQNAVLLARARDNLAANEFMRFLKMPASRSIIRSYGYETGDS